MSNVYACRGYFDYDGGSSFATNILFISMLYLVKKCFKYVTSYIGAYTATLVICLFAVYMCILIVLSTKIKNCIEIYDEQR